MIEPAAPSLPWRTLEDWCEAVRSLERLTRIHRVRLGKAVLMAKRLQAHFESLFALLDELCARTCRHCPDPCCLNAKVWIDFPDLLFLHLSGQPVPQAQLLTDTDEDCRYWTPSGCTLPRIARPWTCTWYLCPAQQAVLRGKDIAEQEAFNRKIQTVKVVRRKLEAEFIRVVA